MLSLATVQTSSDGTEKYLFRLDDGNLIESVFMPHPYGNSVCVSTQAGCNMGCAFCASGLLKKVRDLSAEEMLAQVETIRSAGKKEITHIVVMGTGEPFDNYENVVLFCDRISDPKRTEQAPAPRHITVSTCGIVPGIYDFIHTEKRYNLAISLHAPNDTIRNAIMPVNRKYPMADLLQAAETYCRETKRRVTFEYLLLKDRNDKTEHAEMLAALLLSYPNLLPYVNLIPFNPVSEMPFSGSPKEQALLFYDALMKSGIKATLRKERGGDIDAACGQLRLTAAGKGGNK